MIERTTREMELYARRRSGVPLPFEPERADIHRRVLLGMPVEGVVLEARAQDRPHFENGYSFIFPNATPKDVFSEFDNLRTVTRPKKGNIIFI